MEGKSEETSGLGSNPNPNPTSTATDAKLTASGAELVESGSRINPQVYALARVLRKQREEDHQLALANYKLGSVNLLLGVANYSRNQVLAREQEVVKRRIKEGQQVVQQLEGELEQHEKKLDAAQGDIEENRAKVGDLEENIEQLATKYDNELASQRRLLLEQKRELLKMTLSLFNQDLTVDGSILLLSWVLTNTPLIDWPLRLVTMGTSSLPLIPLRKARRQWVVARLTRILVLVMLSRTLRVGAIRRGWHNSVGSPQAYVLHLLELMQRLRRRSGMSGSGGSGREASRTDGAVKEGGGDEKGGSPGLSSQVE